MKDKLPTNELELRALAARAANKLCMDCYDETGQLPSERDQTGFILAARIVLRMLTGIEDNKSTIPADDIRAEAARQEVECND